MTPQLNQGTTSKEVWVAMCWAACLKARGKGEGLPQEEGIHEKVLIKAAANQCSWYITPSCR